LTCILATLTALALLGAASLREAQVAPPPESASAAVVLHFYDAVNDALRTGDMAALDAVVAPGFVEHEPLPGGTPPDRAGLGRYLTALRATFPALRLTVEAVSAEGDLVMTRVGVRGDEGGLFLGIPLTRRVPTWGRVERFRVLDSRIVERWADAGALGLLQPLQAARIAVPPPLQRLVTFAPRTVRIRVAVAFGSSYSMLKWPLVWMSTWWSGQLPEFRS
jgi:predicted ester cyclase